MNTQSAMDKSAIGLSLLCLAHCLLTPALLILLPAMSATFLEDERFHKALIFIVVPLSSFALFLGCKAHRDIKIAVIGALGLLLLVFAAFVGGPIWGEIAEKSLTVAGALVMVYSHYKNFRLCRSHNCEV